MATEKGFKIEVTSHEPEWWRYNVAFTCGCMDARGERIGYASSQSHIADVGSNPEPPKPTKEQRKAVLETMPCDNLLLYLYVIPHTLPEEREIEATAPFAITIKTFYNGKLLHTKQRSVNRWSGASLEMRISKK